MIDCLSIVETDKEIHTVETDIEKLEVEIESFGMSSDEFNKETESSDGLQPKQADLSCIHALKKLHLHEIRVVPILNIIILHVASSTTSLVAYSDEDWAGCPATWRSTFGYCVFLGNNLLSWSSKCQSTLSHSSAEAKYYGVSNAVAETCWLRNLLHIFAKGLPSVLFEEFRTSLSIRCSPAPTAGEC
ncbi:ribonuclease H-like domain-containing protein [Tanacetum coccineum]